MPTTAVTDDPGDQSPAGLAGDDDQDTDGQRGTHLDIKDLANGGNRHHGQTAAVHQHQGDESEQL